MRRRVLFVSLGFSVLSALAVLVWGAARDRSAAELVAEARARLSAPLREAPELDRIQASTAVSMLARAAQLGRTDEEIEGWLAYARALEDYQRGDLILAEGELSSARRRLGRSADIEVLAAAVARGRSERERALSLVGRALAIDPNHARARLLAADLALDEDDGETALAHLDALVALAPRVGAVRNRRGLARELLGRFEEAEDDYRAATRLDPRAHDAWINLGRLCRRSGRHAEALVAFDEAVRRAPTDADAHLGRGLSRAALGDVEGGRADFERAAELAPNDAEPLLALGDLERDLGAYDDAVATYRRAIAREDADAASWLKLGNVLALLERYDEATRAFRAAIRRAPELAAAFNGLGASLMHLGRTDDAIAALVRAAELDVHDPNPWMNLALLHERAGDRDAARSAWERALERDPASEIARRHLARLES
ncbi:MAG TPA: tetratricopeptide repeat protein [Sandaracinaceae bacterium]